MKFLTTFILSLLVTYGFSQTALRKSSLSTGGGSSSSGNLYMVYAIGEIGVQESTSGNILLSEGFVGPDIVSTVGIEDYGVLNGLRIYPNPVKDNLQIHLPQTGNYEVYIFDLTGKEIFNRNIEDSDEAQYNIADFKTGVYLLIIADRTNKLAATVKLQKL